MEHKIVAVVGSYRRGGMIDQAVETVLAGARERGAATNTIYLNQYHLEFCNNCRKCMETPGGERGQCVIEDDLLPVLAEIDSADAVVLAAPVNAFNVTAVFRLFMERLVGAAYWPWGQAMPKLRTLRLPRRAVLVTSAAMPAWMIPVFTGAMRALRVTARMLGAKPVGRMLIGLAARERTQSLSPGDMRRARRLGWRLSSAVAAASDLPVG